MDRKNLLFALVFMIAGNLTAQNTGQHHITMDSIPAPGVYDASGSITLLPGFSFTTDPVSSLTLRIIPDSCNTGNLGHDYSCRMNHIFQHVNKNKITTFEDIVNAAHPAAVPVAMMHFQYNSLNINPLNITK